MVIDGRMVLVKEANVLEGKSAIGSLHLGCLIKGLKEGLEMQGVEVKIQSLDGYYLLITFFDSKMMKVLTESYLNCFKPWLSNLVAYNYNVVQQEMFCWVRLDEISFQIWHLNSFKALGDRWDEFVKPDANTMALSRLDYGRILFKVKSIRTNLSWSTGREEVDILAQKFCPDEHVFEYDEDNDMFAIDRVNWESNKEANLQLMLFVREKMYDGDAEVVSSVEEVTAVERLRRKPRSKKGSNKGYSKWGAYKGDRVLWSSKWSKDLTDDLNRESE
ncbi:Uncharacterized protein TCM_012991 [Theobroma cacao]|uniref:DUF4283 domain-containing protein n=1 Tax=Theobroma cacao TaxID=3641 RepID=A0A061G326_THECC|nr:Uncharacterized protein TCM_012991 [Theobroma cacao]